jgi:hypothetical protein
MLKHTTADLDLHHPLLAREVRPELRRSLDRRRPPFRTIRAHEPRLDPRRNRGVPAILEEASNSDNGDDIFPG